MRNFLLLVVVTVITCLAAVNATAQCTTNLYTTGCTSDDYLQSFSTTGGTTNISNLNTGCSNTTTAYTYYSSQNHTANPGNTVNFSFTNGPDFSEYYKIWVDFNGNGTFEDATELVYTNAAKIAAAAVVNGSFLIPVSTTPGTKRLRVRAVYSNNTFTACDQQTWGEVEDYNLVVQPSGPCTNPPTAGTISASSNPACSGTAFTLNMTGGTYGTGQTYQWQSSPDGTTWTDIAGATSPTTSVTQTADRYYRLQITCGATVTTASLLVTTQLCYCTSGATNTADEEIYSVTVNGATNNSNCTTVAPGPGSILNRYSNFRTIGSLTTLIPGTSVPFTIVEDECDGATYFNHGAAIWIDFNRDGDFTDAGEQVYVENTTTVSPRTITGSIAIPAGATPGETVMRILVAENLSGAGLTPCGTYGYGETEDYTVTIIPPVPCAGTPTGGTATTTKTPVCLGEQFTLNATGTTQAVGLTYQWQSSPDNTTWTNISGANSISYSTSQSVTTYYRLAITCTNGGAVGYSTSVQVVSPALVSGTFTINSAVPTGGTNFASFNDAYNYIKCGINGPVVFNVDAASGPYNEQLIITPVPGASATNTITFNGNGRTITFNTTVSAQRAVIKLDDADYFTFNNLVITNTNTTQGFGVQLINDADYNTINNNTVNVAATSTSTNFAGIVMSASHTSATTTGNTRTDNNTISNNTVNGGYYGITLVGSSTVAVGNNRITGNNVRDFYFYGIYVNGSFNALVQGNSISRPTRTSVSTFYGIYFTGLSASADVNKNRITNPFGGALTSTSAAYGIAFASVDALVGLENIVSNNLIHTFNGNGDHYGLYNSSSDNIYYYHNTVAFDHTASTSTNVTRGFYQITQADGIILMNNIITISRGGTGAKHALYYGTPTSDIVSNRNDLYVSSTGGTVNAIGFFNNNNYTLLPTWQTATGDDQNSTSIDPIYTAPGSGDYKPTNAAIDNRGTYVDVPDDILGVARNTTTPDIGAYEFTPPPCTAPPVGGAATVSQSPVCINFPVMLSVTGNSSGLTQTFQWQTSTALAGPYTNFGSSMAAPDTVIDATASMYFRLAITCGVSTSYSTPVQLVVTPALPGGTYTINKAVPTGGTNYNSFNAAKAAMACGIAGPVVFNVVPGSGPYNEQLVLDTIPGTSVINTVTFNGNGNTIAFSSTNTNERAVIKLNTTDHITFDSLTIDATPTTTGTTYGFAVQLINNADSNVFRKNTILTSATSNSTNYAGIVISASATSATTLGFASQSDFNLFDGNSVNGGYYGITVVGSTSAAAGPAIVNNRFTNNTVTNFYQYGIYVSGTESTLVEKNDISRPTRNATSPSVITSFYGIYLTGVSTKALISKNRIHNPFAGVPTSTSDMYGIYLTGADATTGTENRIVNNLIYEFEGRGLAYALYNSGSNSALYYHNTVSLDNATNTGTAATRGFYQITSASGIQFRNNIISIERGGTGTKHVMYLATSTSEVYADRNDYYINAGGTANFIGFYGVNLITLADWRTATLQDGNSKSIDPDYVNVAADDYTPGFGAAQLDNLGSPVGVTTDILDAPRSATTPDPGAYEFNIPPCVEPAVAGSSTAIPNSAICMGTPIALNLAGNSVGANQTYQWQSGPTMTGPWTNLSPVQTSPAYTTPATVSSFYRAVVQCGTGAVQYSVPVLVTLNPPLAAGTYTIDPALPASSTNFTSFTTAVNALYCGIAGHVIFNAAPVAFNEQVRVGLVPGTSPTATVTFQTDPASATLASLQFDATSTANYTLRFDSVTYVFFKRLSISAVDNTYGRAVEFSQTASYDSLVNCIINVPATTATTNDIAGVYADQLAGRNNTIKGNIISGGTSGIYFRGVSAADLTTGHNIYGNTISGAFQYGIYTSFTDRTKVDSNSVTINGTLPLSTTAYGIYINNADTAYQVKANNVSISNTNTAAYGIYVNLSDATTNFPGKVANNRVTATTANSGNIWGLAMANSTNADVVNNVIAVATNGTNSYGLWSNLAGQNRYYNNTVNSTATSSTNNIAAYFNHTSGANGNVNIRNNIFSHKGGGKAVQFTNANYIYSDYNMFYTTGTNLVGVGAINYTSLAAFQNAWTWDVNSIVYNPAFVSNTNLQPDLANPEVWAIHGRGVQIPGNDYDFNNNPRPTTLTAGVPDLGAYEFLPTAVPVALTATPAAPVANSTQTFMLGTDTVTKVTWGATVPATVTARRYSGVLPPSLPAGAKSMYFYTDIDVPAPNNYNYSIKQFYIDPWQGFIPTEPQTKLGRTDATNNWIVSTASTVDDVMNVISENNLNFLDKFTGMADPTAPPPPPVYVITGDSSNRGTNFWVPYAHHQFFETDNSQQMVLYLSAEQPANVTVRIQGTPYVKTYAIPANTVITSDLIPKTGIYSAKILSEGLTSRGINITSDVPIVAYAHIYGITSSGATMLMPVGVYGYEYYGLTSRQNYATNTFSWVNVVAAYDSTVVEITPSVPTRGGRPANVPFTVVLNKGDVYQLLGALQSGSTGYDMTGTKVKSISNTSGKCYPFALFSGSSRTGIGCGNLGSSGDNLIQQNFPSQAWGTKYLTAPTSNSTSASNFMTNIYRVTVKDPATVVTVNGSPLTGLINNYFYEYTSNTADYIEANAPVMVAQYMSSSGSCPNTSGIGDPEMIYISPLEQAINKVGFYRTNQQAITMNYLTLVIPTGGLGSLTIDGSGTFDHTYAHPNLAGYTVVVKRWTPAVQSQVLVQSDSAFTAITYGLGGAESYGYNAGTLVKNLLVTSTIQNTLATPGTNPPFTCPNAPFRFTAVLAVKPTQLLWKFSAVSNLSPNTDITQVNPTPVDSFMSGGRKFYKFTITTDYTFSTVGQYLVPIYFTHPSVENCNNTQEAAVKVNVIPGPVADFNFTFTGCLHDAAQFTAPATSGTFTLDRWQWNFGDATTSNVQNPTKTWTAPGTYNVLLRVLSPEGCFGEVTKPVTADPLPIAAVVADSIAICAGQTATFQASGIVAGSTYRWFSTPTGGTALATGTSFTTPALTATTQYYLEVTNAGLCNSLRKRVVAQVYNQLAAPVVKVDTVGAYFARWSWNAIPGATGYQVSLNGGTFKTPSTGATGLMHTETGLTPTTAYALQVRALGVIACQQSTAGIGDTTTLTDQIFIPNTFTPNADGKNDLWRVYGNVITSGEMMVFNQWGEKIFETKNINTGWDGRYKGTVQPVGVYVYVVKLTLENGEQVTKKGVINLVR